MHSCVVPIHSCVAKLWGVFLLQNTSSEYGAEGFSDPRVLPWEAQDMRLGGLGSRLTSSGISFNFPLDSRGKIAPLPSLRSKSVKVSPLPAAAVAPSSNPAAYSAAKSEKVFCFVFFPSVFLICVLLFDAGCYNTTKTKVRVKCS